MSSQIVVFEGMGGWGLGKGPEMGRDLGHAKYGENRSDMDIIRFVILILHDFVYFPAIDSVIHLFDRQRHIYRTTRLEKLVTLI